MANKYTTKVPYSATLTKRFYDGSSQKQKISGVFKGVNIDDVKVEYGEMVPLASLSSGLIEQVERKRRATDLCGDEQKID